MSSLSDIFDDPNILHGIYDVSGGRIYYVVGNPCTSNEYIMMYMNRPLLLWLAYKSREGIISYV